VSASTIDYDALAKQHGGAEQVDYDALASQHGGTVTAAPSAQSTATMSAAPAQGVTGYLQDVQHDLTEGGQRTIVGKGLGYLQGRGDKGYSGLQSGVSPDQAQMMGSVPLGLTKMAIGTSELPSKPLTGTGHILGGALQTATLPSSFVAPEAAEAAGGVGQSRWQSRGRANPARSHQGTGCGPSPVCSA
jgi:hypothetical protein